MRFIILIILSFVCYKVVVNAQNNVTTDIENAKVKKYLEEVQYTYYSNSIVKRYIGNEVSVEDEKPNPIVITLDTPAQNDMTLVVVNDDDNNEQYEQTIAEGAHEVHMYNLKPQQTYTYSITNGVIIVKEGKIITEGHLRMIYLPTIHNIRDLGGWTTTNGSTQTRYGLIFRGSELKGTGNNASDEDIMELRKLGLRAELDLRNEGSTPLKSALGEDIDYKYIHITDISNSYFPIYNDIIKDAFEFIVNSLRQRKPIYIHCTYGADRTGTICGLLESCIGLPANTIYKDYELSSFSKYVGAAREKRSITKRLLDGIGYSAYGNLQNITQDYMINEMDISKKDIDDFTAIMLGTYKYPEYPPTYIQDYEPSLSSRHATYYDLQGRASKVLHRGINIVYNGNGSVKKVMR